MNYLLGRSPLVALSSYFALVVQPQLATLIGAVKHPKSGAKTHKLQVKQPSDHQAVMTASSRVFGRRSPSLCTSASLTPEMQPLEAVNF